MRRETRLLIDKACDSLILGIELYNRPNDRGRINGVLILTNHAFEMLLKAAIIHKGGSVHEQDSNETIGFDTCVRKGTSDGQIKFLTEEQAITIRTLNGLRDAAQHYLVDVSENQLYIQIQSAVRLFKDLFRTVFKRELADELPDRVLPVSTSAPVDISTIFDFEVKEILKLLAPGRRRRIEAEARIRSLALFDARIRGKRGQPSIQDLRRIGRKLEKKHWMEVFQGAATVNVATDGEGPSLAVRFTKREGPPINVVGPDITDALQVGVKRVNELDFYNLNTNQLKEKVGLTQPKLIAVVEFLKMREYPNYYKEFEIGKSLHKRYSQKAIQVVNDALERHTIDEMWEWDKERRQKSKKTL